MALDPLHSDHAAQADTQDGPGGRGVHVAGLAQLQEALPQVFGDLCHPPGCPSLDRLANARQVQEMHPRPGNMVHKDPRLPIPVGLAAGESFEKEPVHGAHCGERTPDVHPVKGLRAQKQRRLWQGTSCVWPERFRETGFGKAVRMAA